MGAESTSGAAGAVALETGAPEEILGPGVDAGGDGDDGGVAASAGPDPWETVLGDAEKEYDAALKGFDPSPAPGGGQQAPGGFDPEALYATFRERFAREFGGGSPGRVDAAPRPAAQQNAYPQELPNPAQDPEGYHRGMLEYTRAQITEAIRATEERVGKTVEDRFTRSQATLTDYAVSQVASREMLANKFASTEEVENGLRGFYARTGRIPTETDVKRIVTDSHRRVEKLIAEDRKAQVVALRARATALKRGPQPGGTSGRLVSFTARLRDPKTSPKTREERAQFVADGLQAGLGEEGEF